MDDFVFCGKSIADFGATAAFGAAMKIGAKIARSDYSLPGGGVVEIGEPSYKATQRAVTITPRDGVEASPAWRRAILGWLQAQRGEMTVLNDPDVSFVASFDAEGTYGTQGWPLGEIKINMTLQPMCYATQETVTIRETEGGAASIPVEAHSALSMPVCLALERTSGTITAATIAAGGHTLSLAGLSLGAGQRLVYDAGRILGDPARLTVAGKLDFSGVRQWALLTVPPSGFVTVRVTGGEARCVLMLRGRWPA